MKAIAYYQSLPIDHAEALLEAVERQGHPRQDNTTIVVVRWR